MGIYRRSNTNKQREGNLSNIFVSEENFKSNYFLETANKIIRVRIRALSSSFFFSFFSFFVIFFYQQSFCPLFVSFLHLFSLSSSSTFSLPLLSSLVIILPRLPAFLSSLLFFINRSSHSFPSMYYLSSVIKNF